MQPEFKESIVLLVQIHSVSVLEVMSSMRPLKITTKHVSSIFNICLEIAKKMLLVTTESGTRQSVHPITGQYRIDHLDLHHKQLKKWYLDHFQARNISLLQNTGAWVNKNKHFTEVCPTKQRSNVTYT